MKKFSYTVLLTRSQTSLDEDPAAAFRSFMNSSIQTMAVDLQKVRTDVIQRNGTVLRGGLTQFLSTPLKSDKDEIIKLIEDSIENTVQQLDAAPMLSTVEHSLWSIIDPQEVPLHRHSMGIVKRLLKNGRTMLANAGCSFGKNAAPVIVSQFHFDGFSTILPLKKLIDQFGEQQLLDEVNNAMHTQIVFFGAPVTIDRQLMMLELDLQDSAVIESIHSEIQQAVETAGAEAVSISVQTFHSILGSTVQLCCSFDMTAVAAGSIVLALSELHPEIKSSLNNNGSIILLQPLV